MRKRFQRGRGRGVVLRHHVGGAPERVVGAGAGGGGTLGGAGLGLDLRLREALQATRLADLLLGVEEHLPVRTEGFVLGMLRMCPLRGGRSSPSDAILVCHNCARTDIKYRNTAAS